MNIVNLFSVRDRFVAFFGEEPTSVDAIVSIEAFLHVVLPDDMKQIAAFYRGGYVGGISHHAIAATGPAHNIGQETERLRSAVALPHRFVVLAEPPESLIVLDCESHISAVPAVIWCDAQDVKGLNNTASLSRPEIWSSYLEFFSHLLEEEEKDRGRR